MGGKRRKTGGKAKENINIYITHFGYLFTLGRGQLPPNLIHKYAPEGLTTVDSDPFSSGSEATNLDPLP